MVGTTAPTAVPVLNPEQKLKLMEPLLKVTRNEGQIESIKNQLHGLEAQKQGLQAQAQNALVQVFNELGINVMEWGVNLDTFTLYRTSTVSPQPAVAQAVAEAAPVPEVLPVAGPKGSGRRKASTGANGPAETKVATPTVQ